MSVPTTEMLSVDILIIGGGVQGLVLLRHLTQHGYACVLVTNGDLGSGQTLHSHGFFNSGYPFLRHELRDALKQTVLPAVRERRLQLYGENDGYIVAPPPAMEAWRKGWDVHGYDYEEALPASLPAGFQDGVLFRGAPPARAVKIREYSFPKRQLVKLLSDGLLDRVIRGDVASFRCAPEAVEDAGQGKVAVESVTVRVQATAEMVSLAPRTVIVAAGAGTKRLVESLAADLTRGVSASAGGGPTAWRGRIEKQLAQVKHRKMHMLCVRAPRDVLPATSILAVQQGLMVVAHLNHDHDVVGGGSADEVTWYVTPADLSAPHADTVPDDALAEADPALVTRGFTGLLSIYPALRKVAEGPDSRVQFAAFAGYKQDIGDQMAQPACQRLEGVDNVIIALPSALIGAWINAQRALAMLEGRVVPQGRAQTVPSGGRGVRVGHVHEMTDGVTWMPWTALLERYPGVASGT